MRVPVQNRVGDENKGWTYAKFLLGHERTNIAGIGGAKRELARLKRIASIERKNGRPLIEDPLFAANIAQVEIDLWALEITNLRVLSGERGAKAPGPEASILKIRGTEIAQRISELLMRAVGAYALPLRREAMEAGWQSDPTLEAAGPRYAVDSGCGVHESAQAVDLRRHQRNSEEHHFQDDRWSLENRREPHELRIQRRAAAAAGNGRSLSDRAIPVREIPGHQRLGRGLGQSGLEGARRNSACSRSTCRRRRAGWGLARWRRSSVMGACGRSLLLEPFLSSAVIATALLRSFGADAAAARVVDPDGGRRSDRRARALRTRFALRIPVGDDPRAQVGRDLHASTATRPW